MIIYLAGRYSSKERMVAVAKLFRDQFHNAKIPCTWITGEHDDATPIECATTDIKELSGSDLVVAFTDDQGSRGGMYVEIGIAIAKGIPVIIVGPYTNVFTRLCRRVDSVEEILTERTRHAISRI